MAVNEENTEQKRKSGSIRLDLRLLCGVLLLVIVALIMLWRPWNVRSNENERTVKVTGETSIKAEADEFVFYPNYIFRDSDQQKSIDEANAKRDAIVAKLKELGVTEQQIKVDTYGYSTYPQTATLVEQSDYTLSLTVTIQSKDLANKVQEYINTTAPTGSVTPQAQFSKAKQKMLENQAREEATKDAKIKADLMASNLGFKVGGVKSVEEGAGFDGSYWGKGGAYLDATSSSSPILSGLNEYTYSVSVEYFVR